MHELPKELGAPFTLLRPSSSLPPSHHSSLPQSDARTHKEAGRIYVQLWKSILACKNCRGVHASLSPGPRISGSLFFSPFFFFLFWHVVIWCREENFLRSTYFCASVSTLIPCNRSLCDCLLMCHHRLCVCACARKELWWGNEIFGCVCAGDGDCKVSGYLLVSRILCVCVCLPVWEICVVQDLCSVNATQKWVNFVQCVWKRHSNRMFLAAWRHWFIFYIWKTVSRILLFSHRTGRHKDHWCKCCVFKRFFYHL